MLDEIKKVENKGDVFDIVCGLDTYMSIDDALAATILEFKNHEIIDHTRLESQIEILTRVANGMKNGTRCFVIEAPTGVGKSIFAYMLTRFVSILTNEEKNTGYICTSNKQLQDQYESDIALFGFSTFASLKGMANYTCDLNGKNGTNRKCKKIGLGAVMSSNFASCGETCKLVQDRISAIKSESAIFNYSYFLSTMNYVYANVQESAPFQPRPVSIFDECQELQSIMQNMFTIPVNILDIIERSDYAMEQIKMFYGKNLMVAELFTHKEVVDYADFKKILKTIHDNLLTICSFSDKTDQLLTDAVQQLDTLYKTLYIPIQQISKVVNTLFPKNKNDYNDWQEEVFNICKKFVSLYSTLNDIIESVFKADNTSLVIDVDAELTYTVRCDNERKLIQDRLLPFTNISVFMSATIGTNMDEFASDHGITNYMPIKIPMKFKFDNCPIYRFSPSLPLTYAHKVENMPRALSRMEMIIEKYKDQKGIIHTGSYALMEEISNHFMYNAEHGHRFLYCKNAEEKQENILRMQESDEPYILAGPSLLEGVDLKDDLARFLIFAKTPYPSLADELVKRKQKKFKNWYGWQTMNKFEQGIGRPVRHPDDWAHIYLLDGGFDGFLARERKRVKPWIHQRFEVVYDTDDGLVSQKVMLKKQKEAALNGLLNKKNKPEPVEHKSVENTDGGNSASTFESILNCSLDDGEDLPF